MTSNPRKLYEATQTLFRAFHHLLPRMKGGGLALPQPMNPEALADASCTGACRAWSGRSRRNGSRLL